MNFAEQIDKYIHQLNLLEIGEVKIHQTYLYSEKYEIVINTLPNRKVLQLTMRTRIERKSVLSEIGTLSYLLRVATGYVRHY